MIEEFGVNGVYLDGTYAHRTTTNPNYEHAYVHGSEMRPTNSIFDTRDFMKRWYRACKNLDPNFYFQGHTSSGAMALTPMTAFLDYSTAGETIGALPGGTELPWSFWRASQTGRQFGVQQEFFTTTTFDEPYALPLALVHGSSVYGRGNGDLVEAFQTPVWSIREAFGINEASWVPYWKAAGLITSSHPDVRVSYHVKPQQVLLVAATNKRIKPQATVTIDLVGLDLDPGNVTGTYREGVAFDTTPDPDLKLRLDFPTHNGQNILSNDSGFVNYVWLRSDQ